MPCHLACSYSSAYQGHKLHCHGSSCAKWLLCEACSANVMIQWWYLVTGDGETWMDSNHWWQWNWQTVYSSDRTKSKPGGTISCWKNQSIEFSCWKGCKNDREQSQHGSCGSSAEREIEQTAEYLKHNETFVSCLTWSITFELVNCIEAEDSGFLGCDIVLSGSSFQWFRRMCFHLQESGNPRSIGNHHGLLDRWRLRHHGDPENIVNHSPSDRVSHPSSPELWAALLERPHISHCNSVLLC